MSLSEQEKRTHARVVTSMQRCGHTLDDSLKLADKFVGIERMLHSGD